MDEQEKAALKNFIFVTRETHLKLWCKCPDCGSNFSRWILGGYDMDSEEIEMQRTTTECERCEEERLEEEYEEEEESFGLSYTVGRL